MSSVHGFAPSTLGSAPLSVDPAAEGAAARVLTEFWFEDSQGLPKVPVDPIAIARRLGIDVFTSVLAPSVAGIIIKERGGTPSIHLNLSDALVRQRFTCGHEIGHYMHREDANDYGYVDYRDALSGQGTDPEERWANGFAAALLMPQQVVTTQRQLGAEYLARNLNVSLEAMRNRLANLG